MKQVLLIITLVLILSFNIFEIDVNKEKIAPGIYKLSIGVIDKYTPFSLSSVPPKLDAISKMGEEIRSIDIDRIIITKNKRGCSVAVPLKKDEQIYGFGLQMGSFGQRGLKKKPIVNDHPLNNLGYSHAPQPFYVSTEGYGILINTSRYTTFLCGTENRLKGSVSKLGEEGNAKIEASTEELYKSKESNNYVFIDIPNSEGIEVFVIEGTDVKNVVERYNLLAGGGCLPPIWGLGLKYRTKANFNESQVLEIADYFRTKQIPCDVIGLEPGWQTATYSCSYVWNKDRFPDPKRICNLLNDKGFKLNLWEHAYVHPTSPIHNSLVDYSGNFLVWNGLVPDFILPETRKIFGDYHLKLIADGVSSFKLDECDNSNITRGSENWGFPDMSVFPSGIDGEQMHQLFGSLYLRTMNDIFKNINRRTYMDYRSSNLFMSSFPATLYSDTYDQKEYIQMICNASFGGLLWSPELRESDSPEELFHRLQTVLLSPQSVINSWYLQSPPWLQYDKEKNNQGLFLSNSEEMEQNVRKLMNMRMSLIPYLYSAFANYYSKGTPPFRPLIMDYGKDLRVRDIDDQYMIGNCIMAAPLYGNGNKRKVYFPEGIWYDFNTNKMYKGGQDYEIETSLHELPIYVKSGSIIPIAKPVQSLSENTVFDITCNVYGSNAQDFTLFEDDGITYNFEKGDFNQIVLSIVNQKGIVNRTGTFKTKRYIIEKWNFIQ